MFYYLFIYFVSDKLSEVLIFFNEVLEYSNMFNIFFRVTQDYYTLE